MVRLVFRPYTKFDDRFARQNRYEPPPEFPLASPYSGIVHHLSGPNIHALPQIFSQSARPGVSAPHDRDLNFCFHYAHEFNHPNTRRHVRILGPCFKTGRLKPLCQHPKHLRGQTPTIKACCRPQSHSMYTNRGYNTPGGATFPCPFSTEQNWCWPITKEIHQAKEQGWIQSNATDFKRFPFNNFTYCLTLFFKVLFHLFFTVLLHDSSINFRHIITFSYDQ